MAGISEIKNVFAVLNKKIVGDSTDRLVNLSSLLGLVCCMTNLGLQIIGTPLTCVSKYDRDYVNSICYTKSFYQVPLEEHSIKLRNRDEYAKINYFQFLAIFFFTQAAVLYIPSYFWKKNYKKADIKLGNIVRVAVELRDSTGDRSKKLAAMAETIVKKIESNQQTGIWNLFSNSLSFRYALVKIANAGILLYFIHNVASFLSDNFWWSGERFLGLFNGEKWIDSERFPRLAYCDFQMRDMANVKNVTAQCVLAMNFVSEKLFFLEWIWFSFTFILVLINLAKFVFLLFCRQKMLANWLFPHSDKQRMKIGHFATKIGWDGWLAIVLVESAAGRDIASDFAAHLYDRIIIEDDSTLQVDDVNSLQEKNPLADIV